MLSLPHNILVPNRPDPQNSLRLDMASLPMIQSMEQNGMRIDRTHMLKLHKQLTGDMEDLQSQVTKIVGKTINIGSGDQLAHLLFSELKLKQAGKEKWTKSRARLAADSDVLRGMISQHPCIPIILQWKIREKLRSTYTYSLISQADENDRIHPDFNHTGPETGRLSCSDPNLQNIPIRTMLGREIRNAFIPSKGMVLGTVDASQIEMRTMCHDATCKGMLNIFWKWEDLYWGVAEDVYQRKFTEDERKNGIDEDTGQTFKNYYRFNAKTTALGVTYATSPEGLVDIFLTAEPPAIGFLTSGDKVWNYDKHYRTAVANCTEAIRKFFAAYPEILKRRQEHHRRAKKYGFVWDMFGRIRWIPQVYSTHQWIVGEGLRAAGNLAGQGGAAGIVKLWMACIWDKVESYWGRRGVKMLCQIHDELLSEGPKEVMPDFLDFCGRTLRNLMPGDTFMVPLESDSDQGERWGDLK